MKNVVKYTLGENFYNLFFGKIYGGGLTWLLTMLPPIDQLNEWITFVSKFTGWIFLLVQLYYMLVDKGILENMKSKINPIIEKYKVRKMKNTQLNNAALPSKQFFKSATVWISGFVAFFLGLDLFNYLQPALEFVNQIIEILPMFEDVGIQTDGATKWLSLIASILIIFIRIFKTRTVIYSNNQKLKNAENQEPEKQSS